MNKFKKLLFGIITAALIFNFGGNCMAKDVLTQKQHNIVMISSYTANGDMENLEKL